MSINFNPGNFVPSMGGYTGQEPFRFWCQKVLPLVYDDSLSYYELLNKVVTYLNNTISDVATMEGNVEALHDSFADLQEFTNTNIENLVEAFNTLETFVNDYFDNLDVQEEIDNKLDEMATDGTLSNLMVASGAIEGAVSAWLDANITPTTPPVDPTLAIENAAADANITGFSIRQSDKVNFGTKIETTFERGSIRDSGELVDNVNRIRSSNYIPYSKSLFLINKTWVVSGYTTGGFVILYDENYNVIAKSSASSNDELRHLMCDLSVYSSYNPSYIKYSLIISPTPLTEKMYSVITDNLITVDTNGSLFKTVIGDPYKHRGNLQTLGVTSLSQCVEPGWYNASGSYLSSLADAPASFSGAITLEVTTPTYADATNARVVQTIYNTNFTKWRRLIRLNGTVDVPWILIQNGRPLIQYKNIAIIGDSISTSGTWSESNPEGNTPEIIIESADVGVQLSAFATYYDIGTTVGGHTIDSSDVGNEITFTPTASDVGKAVGLSANYNAASLKTWWKILEDKYTLHFRPVCWSGASISSHEKNTENLKCSYAWHESQIRKCGIRTAGTMTRTSPDIIIIYRGINDFSHAPYTRLTAGYYDAYNWSYPNDDYNGETYGFKEGIALTIKRLREAYPEAFIVLCTMNTFKRNNHEHFPVNNGINSTPQYNQAIREAADFYGCGLIDFAKDGITFENCYTGGYITDSSSVPTHPNAKGHEVMARRAEIDLIHSYNLKI